MSIFSLISQKVQKQSNKIVFDVSQSLRSVKINTTGWTSREFPYNLPGNLYASRVKDWWFEPPGILFR